MLRKCLKRANQSSPLYTTGRLFRHFLGNSSGAALIIEAATSGLPITKLVLFEPPYVAEASGDNRPPADAVAQLNVLNAAGQRGDAVEYFMTKVMGVPVEFVTPMRNAPMWPELEDAAPTLAYEIMLMGNWLVPKGAALVTAPTLAIDSENSPPMLRQAVQAVVDAMPNAQRRSLAGQSHEAVPQAIAPLLIEFFKA